MGKKYTVIRDTREQSGRGWVFEPEKDCLGTKTQTLSTGDYTLEGFEHLLSIERKGRISEFVKNICEDRFEKELCRLDDFLWPFIILEFTVDDIFNWPKSSGLSPKMISTLKTSPRFILKRINDILVKHKTKVIFAGLYGKSFAESIFKRVAEHDC